MARIGGPLDKYATLEERPYLGAVRRRNGQPKSPFPEDAERDKRRCRSAENPEVFGEQSLPSGCPSTLTAFTTYPPWAASYAVNAKTLFDSHAGLWSSGPRPNPAPAEPHSTASTMITKPTDMSGKTPAERTNRPTRCPVIKAKPGLST